MAELMRVPEVAAGDSQVILSEWLVSIGTPFSAGDALAVIETEKAVVEIEAETDAVLLRILVGDGSTVEVGSPLALLGSPDEADLNIDGLLVEMGVGSTENRAPRQASNDTVAAQNDAPSQPSTGRVFISPIARTLLRRAGIPFDEVAGSGPGGRIVRKDVEAAIAARTSAPPPVPVGDKPASRPAPAPIDAHRNYRDEPHSRFRRAIAKRLAQSKQQIPHFYVKRTVRLDALQVLRSEVNDHAATRVSVNDLLIRAVAVTHTRVPAANVIWTDDALRYFEDVDIAIAVASDRGLVTPVLRDVARQSIGSISTTVKAYVEQANSGKLQQKDLDGGSIGISNLGMFGVDEFSAIINPPQSAILAVGAGRPVPVVVDGVLAVATCAELVLSVDHRAIDGALAARWMDTLVSVVESPVALLV